MFDKSRLLLLKQF